MPKGAARGGNEGGIDVEDFDGFQSSLFSALAQLARASQPLKPADLSFYKSLSPTFTQRLQSSSDKLLGVCNRVFNHAAAAGTSSSSTKEAANFQDSDDLVDDFDLVVDVVDSLLEKADTCMDEVTGRIKKNAPDSVPGQSAPVMLQVSAGGPGSAKGGKSSFNVVAAQNIVRPQLRFEDKVDNSNRPHERKITFKPNAKVPLETATQSMSDKPSAELIESSLPHAYEHEIRTIEYPESMFKIRPEQLYASMDQTPCTWVDTEEKLLQMATLLDSAEEIAIDTEHHDYRSFQGFVCLIQVSTRNEDFLIDALALRNHLHVLNSCFTNPNIVKVLHGAEMDIVWLQKDFGLYIVNLFDTYHASHMLEMSQHGLAFLLKYYCSVETNKAYQLADWRIRPLPTEMLKYARSDTHYLLYVYDRMRNELLTLSNPETHNLMHATLERSQQTSLNKYEKDVYDLENGHGPNGWRNALRKFGGTLSAKQFAVFRAIHAWRDHTAREEDESQRYVLPNHMLYTLADRMPIDAQGVLGCCHPVPPLVRLHATDIAIIIDNTLVEVTRAKETMEAQLKQVREEMAQREREWQERKLKGPVHKRFTDGDEDENKVQDSDQFSFQGKPSSAKVAINTTSSLFGSTPFNVPEGQSTAPKITRVAVTNHSIFGGGRAEKVNAADEDAAREMMERIRRTLYLVAPSTDLLKRKRPAEPEASSNSVPMEVSTNAPDEDISDISSDSPSNGNSPEPMQQSDAVDPVAAGTDTITIGDENISIIKTTGSTLSKKRKSKKKKTGASAASGTATAEEIAQARQDVDDVMEVIMIESGDEDGGDKRKKQQASKRLAAKAKKNNAGRFNPHGPLDEDPLLKKKPPRPTNKPLSGNKSGTFK